MKPNLTEKAEYETKQGLSTMTQTREQKIAQNLKALASSSETGYWTFTTDVASTKVKFLGACYKTEKEIIFKFSKAVPYAIYGVGKDGDKLQDFKVLPPPSGRKSNFFNIKGAKLITQKEYETLISK